MKKLSRRALSNLATAIDITADGGDEDVGVEGCGGGLVGVDGEGGELRTLPGRRLQQRGRGGAEGGRALLQHPPPVVEGDEEDDDDEEDGRDETPEDHGQKLRSSLLVLDLGLRQQLDGLQFGHDWDVDGLTDPELVPDLDLDSVRGSW